MRKTTLLWASVCLLLSGAFRPLDAAPEREDEEDADGTGRPSFCFLESEVGPCLAHFKRYFYNHGSGRCEEFGYGGCQGNQNNFETEADCQRSCGDPDDSAQPTASSTPGLAKRNSAVWGRPDFCFLEAEVGPCRANIMRYFYNHVSGRCEEFGYGGCDENLNNFETEADCQRSCGDPDDSAQPTASSTPSPAKRNAGVPGRPDFCFLEAKVGRCRASFKRYFYNHRSGRCEQFVYGGCDGNLNNFETEADCERSCGDPDDSAQATASSSPGLAKRNAAVWGRPDFCFLDSEVGPCFAYLKRYFYNHGSGRCEEFGYGGCQGNLNNFETEEDCQRSCGDPDDSAQPTASSTPGPAKRKAGVPGQPGFCFLEAKVGRCRAGFKRYFYNHRSGHCEQFVYGGCDGNLNNFETEADCQRSCGDPDDSTQPAASSTPGRAKRNAGVQAFTKRTPEGRLMETKRRKNSVEIGYEIY